MARRFHVVVLDSGFQSPAEMAEALNQGIPDAAHVIAVAPCQWNAWTTHQERAEVAEQVAALAAEGHLGTVPEIIQELTERSRAAQVKAQVVTGVLVIARDAEPRNLTRGGAR